MTLRRTGGRRTSTVDRKPPTGKWVARTPSAGATVSGTIYLDLLAIDNRGMASVTFYINGQPVNAGTVLEATSRGGVYSTEVNTLAFASGAYNVSAYLAAAAGPGMTKNLGTITIDNPVPPPLPSIAITSHTDNEEVTLPVTITATVTPSGQEYDTPVIDINGIGCPDVVEVSPNVWTCVITSATATTPTFTAAPYITLGGDQRVYGQAINLINGGYYGAVSVSYAISDTTVNVGDTVTITPTITGDTTDIVIGYNFNDGLSSEVTSPDSPTGAVSYAYPVPGTYQVTARVTRAEALVEQQTLSAITVSAVPSPDTTAPTISVSSPANGATVSGNLSYSYAVSDAVGVSLVIPTLNGVSQQAISISPASTSTTVTTSVDTTQYADGALTIGGTAYDAAGNAGTSPTITVTIDNIPTAPDVRVLGNNATIPIADGSTGPTAADHTLFPSVIDGGAASTRTFTVENTGLATLTTSGLTVPTGFTITEGLSASIAAGASDTFTVQLDAASVGVKSGEISFATNVAGKNPYNFAIQGEVTAAPPPPDPSAEWYDWAAARPFSSMTETRRNMSGMTQVNAPVTFLAQFHPGEIPTTHKLQLRDNGGSIVPETDWQWGERSTYPDGSLRSCVVRCYGPASWVASTDQTWTLEKISGAWPAETDNRPVSVVAANSNFRILLEDITLIGKPAGSTTQPVYNGGATLDFDLNRALARAHVPRKRTAGSIFTQWYTWEKLKVPGSAVGSGGDAELWCKCWVNVWFVPGTDTVRHISVHPLMVNGWDTVQGFAKAFKMKILNGATTLRDHNPTFTRTPANFVGHPHTQSCFTYSDAASFDYQSAQCTAGSAVKITGDVPSGITANKIYAVTYWGETPYVAAHGTCYAGFNEGMMRPYLCLAKLGEFKTQSWLSSLGTGGGTMTFQVYQLMLDKNVFAIRDRDAQEYWLVGGTPYIWPNWTRAEKIRRFQTAMLPPCPIDPVPNNPRIYAEGRRDNGTKNTGAIPVANHLQSYQPGATLHHPTVLEAGGYYQGTPDAQGKHKGEVSWYIRNVLNDMCSTTAPWHRIQRQCAAEAISFLSDLGIYESDLDSNGVEYATHICKNNGPSKSGSRYSNMGPCFPNAGGWLGAGVASNNEYQFGHWSWYRQSGSHCTKEFAWAYALYCDPADLEAIMSQWTRVAGAADRTTSNPWDYNKTYNGTIYYRVGIPDTLDNDTRRNAIGRSLWLAYALWCPDSEPQAQYFKDIAADNVAYGTAVIADPDYFGGTARVIGMPTGVYSGVQQSWHIYRAAYAQLLLIKASGRRAPELVKHLSAFTRWYWGDPIDGAPAPPFAKTGWLGTVGKFMFFDKAKRYSSNVGDIATNAGLTLWRFRDETSSSTDGSTCMPRLHRGPLQILRTDGETMLLTNFDTDKVGTQLYPQNGDQIGFHHEIYQTLPVALSMGTPYWVYDRVDYGRYIKVGSVTGTKPTVGTTMSSGAKTGATIFYVNQFNNWFIHTRPTSGGDFVGGEAITCSNGATFTYPTIQDPAFTYKLSSTQGSVTPVTWAAGVETNLQPLADASEPSVFVKFQTPRVGPRAGGLIDGTVMQQNQVMHITQSGLLAATVFGPSAGCDTAVANYRTFISTLQTTQGIPWDMMNYGLFYWVGMAAFEPGSA